MPRFTRSMQLQNHDGAWMKTLHDDLLACGLVQTSDTGQLDLSSAGPAWVNTTNYVYGYTVYRWDDDEQANYPLFLRIQWENASDVDAYELNISLGQGSDGSGALTGVVTASYAMRTSATSSPTQNAVAFDCYIAGDGTAFAFALTPSSPNTGNNMPGRVFAAFDRMRDTDGTPNANGGCMLLTGGAITQGHQCRYLAGQSTAGGAQSSGSAAGVAPALVPWGWWGDVPSLIADDDMPFFPYYFLTPAANAVLTAVAIPAADHGLGSTFTGNHLGASREFMSLGAAFTGMDALRNANVGVAILWPA